LFQKKEEDFIKNLDSRRRIRSQFVVADKQIKTGKTGRKFIDLTLTDKTGRIIGRIFPEEIAEDLFDTIETRTVYRIIGNLNEFPHGSGRYNIIIDIFNKLQKDEYNLDDFVIVSKIDKTKLLSEIKKTIKNIQDPYLKNLLNKFFDDEKFIEEFSNTPSAKIYHHNYIGGLLEHSVGVLKICKTVFEIFPVLNADLLYTAAILHDIGKIKTYDYDLISIDFSTEGKLLDHLIISCDMVKEMMNGINMPYELSTQLLHIILSHHGDVQNGWGSAVNPKTPEAVALHYADNLDAKVKGTLQNNII